MDKTCKYYKYQRYVSYDNGQTWQPMNQFQRGELMEFNSPDCGAGAEAIYKWVEMDINSDYWCDNCDYVPPAIYRWRAASVDDYICSGTTKYYKEYKEESTNSGATWSTVYPLQYRMSNQIIETKSDDCGYTIYRWVDSGFTCDGTDKYNQVIQQMSRDSGTTWTNVTPSVFSATTLIEEDSEDCGYITGTSENTFSLTVTASSRNFNDTIAPTLTVTGSNGFSGRCTYDNANSTNADTITHILGTLPYYGNMLTFDSRNNGNYYATTNRTSITTLEGVTYSITVTHKGYKGGVTAVKE